MRNAELRISNGEFLNKRKLFFPLFTICSLVISVHFLHGESFKIVGSRALAVGGACVAACEGSLAQYWNPANFKVGAFEFNLTGGAEAQATGDLLKEANDLASLAAKIDAVQAQQNSSGTLTAPQVQAFIKAVKEISDLNKTGAGVLVGANIQGSLKISKFGVSLLNTTELGGDPFVDTNFVSLGGMGDQNALAAVGNWNGGVLTDVGTTTVPSNLTDERNVLRDFLCANFASVMPDFDTALSGCLADAERLANELVNQANNAGVSETDITAVTELIGQVAGNNVVSGSTTNFKNNKSKMTMRAAGLTELALTLPLPLPQVFGLSFGTNLKLIRGDMAFFEVNVLDESQGYQDLWKKRGQYTATSYKPALDLGVSWDLSKILPLRFGAVARNINRPSFDKPKDNPATTAVEGEGGVFKADPQVRAGLALWPFGSKWWSLMADVDLTENSTLIPGFKSRYGAIGTEIMLGGKGFGLAFRAGALKNMAQGLKPVVTGGVGLNFLHLSFEVAGAISTNRVVTESGKKIPESFYLAGNFALRF